MMLHGKQANADGVLMRRTNNSGMYRLSAKGRQAAGLLASVSILTLLAPTSAHAAMVIENTSVVTVPWNVGTELIIGLSGNATLRVENGGAVSSTSGSIGFSTTSTGLAIISGSGSTWTSAGGLNVGVGGTGALTIESGGIVNSGTGVLGDGNGSSGSVTVTGTGSAWNAGELRLGRAGTGTLLVQNGGMVGSSEVAIGQGSGSEGTVTVSGSGSVLSNTGLMSIGSSGDGTLHITEGGRVSSGSGLIGYADVNGTVTISGAGSAWENSANLDVGYDGTGTITITNGGRLISTDASLGYSAGSAGMVTVNGSGSRWDNSGLLRVGVAGSGTLTIQDGGHVSSGEGVVDAASGTTGRVLVSGGGSTWDSSDTITVGRFGTGALTVENAGSVTSVAGILGDWSGASGAVTVRGAGSSWEVSDALNIGYEGAGTLTIENGGRVGAAGSYLGFNAGSAGAATIRGAGSTWNDDTVIVVGMFGTGTIGIQDSGTINSQGGVIGGMVGSSGTVTVSGTGSTWNSTSLMAVGFEGTGTLTIQDGGRVNSDQGVIGSEGGGSGTVTITGNGSAWSTSYLDVGYEGTGTLNIEPGGHLRSDRTVLARYPAANGTVGVSGVGATWDNSDDLVISDRGTGMLTIENGGRVSTATTELAADGLGLGSLTLRGSQGARGILVTGQVTKGSGSASLLFDGGVLQASADQGDFLSGFAAGDITLGNGGIVFNPDGHHVTVSSVLGGSGGLTQAGAGTLTLTGHSTYTGSTLVQAGQLTVEGSLTSAVTVASGAILSGSGEIGGLTVRSGGIAAPGSMSDTLKVAGNVAFQPGSVYRAQINASGTSDKIAATGAAALNGGTVRVLSGTGSYQPGMSYDILAADGGVTGRFANAKSDFAFLGSSLVYTDKAVALVLMRKTEPQPPRPKPEPPKPLAFDTVAGSNNQASAARALEALGSGHPLFDAVIGQSAAGARQAFDALSGEAHASSHATAVTGAGLVQTTVLSRLRNAPAPTFAQVQGTYAAAYAADVAGAVVAEPVSITVPSLDPRRFALWGQGFGTWGSVDASANVAGLDTATGGFILGAEARLDPTWTLGLAGGFTRTAFEADARLSSGSTDTVFASVYGAAAWGQVNLRLGASYAWHDIDTKRSIRFPGFADEVSASYGGSTVQAFGEVGYALDLGRMTLEPFVGASVLRLHTDGFQEEGGPAAMTGYAQDQDLATTTLGVRAAARLSEELPLSVRGLLGWRHAYGDVNPTALLAFAGGTSSFAVAGTPVDRDALVAEAGLDWQASRDISLGVSYEGQVGSRAQEHTVKGSFIWRFGTR